MVALVSCWLFECWFGCCYSGFIREFDIKTAFSDCFLVLLVPVMLMLRGTLCVIVVHLCIDVPVVFACLLSCICCCVTVWWCRC